MSFKDHFTSVADAYARTRPLYPPELFAWLASLAPARRLAWDGATGNGQAAVALARHVDRVIATDASARQIENAFPHERVTYRVAPCEAPGLDEATVDLITIAQALHWVDLDRFYPEVRRVLAPRGVLAVWCYGLFRTDDAVTRAVDRFALVTLADHWPPERRWIDDGFRTIPFPFDEIVAPPFAMTAEWDLPAVLGYIRTWSAVQDLVARRGPAELDTFEAEASAIWGEPSTSRRIAWPLGIRVGRVATGDARS